MKNTLYALKALACFFVVTIHVSFPGKLGTLCIIIARFAVPLFFMISGYFTYHSDKEQTSKKINKRLKKLLKLTAISFIFYLLLHIVILLKDSNFSQYINNVFSLKNISELILLNYTTHFIGVGHLWYLFALIYIYLLFKFINKYNLFKSSYVYSIIAIIAVYIFEVINIVMKLNISDIYYRNFLLLGFPIFMLGHFIHKHEEKFIFEKSKQIKIYILGIILFAIIFCIEASIFNIKMQLYLNTIILTILLFVFALNNNNITIANNLGKFDSGNIYIIHYAVIIVIDNILKIQNFKMLLPFMVFGISYLLSVIYRKAKHIFISRAKAVYPN